MLAGGKFKMETENKDTIELDTVASDVEEPIVEEIKPKKSKKMLIGKVIGGTLNLRAEPDSDSDIIYVLKNGDAVIIDTEGSTDKYYKVTVNGLIGYCVRSFITV
jgi:uncharacterized protein YgiM (DUF1202 family)